MREITDKMGIVGHELTFDQANELMMMGHLVYSVDDNLNVNILGMVNEGGDLLYSLFDGNFERVTVGERVLLDYKHINVNGYFKVVYLLKSEHHVVETSDGGLEFIDSYKYKEFYHDCNR